MTPGQRRYIIFGQVEFGPPDRVHQAAEVTLTSARQRQMPGPDAVSGLGPQIFARLSE